jgi:hypothetical protein
MTTTYSCRIVDVDDQAIARKIFSAANDIAAIATARHLFAETRGDAVEAWEGERLVYCERLLSANDLTQDGPDIRSLGYAAAAVLAVTVASVGALLPYV